jgi:hypothetical protein
MSLVKKTSDINEPEKFSVNTNDMTDELVDEDIEKEMFKDMPPQSKSAQKNDDPINNTPKVNTEQDISDEISRDLHEQ